MRRRLASTAVVLCLMVGPASGQRPEIAIDPPGLADLPRSPPVNHLARCLADPEDKISCHAARTAKRDGGLESAIAGHMDTVVYVPCRTGVCLELATFDADERTGTGTGAVEQRLKERGFSALVGSNDGNQPRTRFSSAVDNTHGLSSNAFLLHGRQP